ncbi:hypothetical protein [Nocardia sp. NPDC049707]|uniref:hypothetical protein n=1 Tax=Nocardia sp. NPDC049707 TaxID=3154735 RepID=UPI0034425646
MSKPELPHQTPLGGRPTPLAIELPVDVVERYLNALREWQTDQTRTAQPDQGV